MIHRFELADKQFALIEDLLPARGKRGGRWNDHRVTLNGIFWWWLYTGAQWREVPERYGKAKSIYDRSNFWRADGTLDKILDRLHLRLNEEGRIDPVLWGVDATSIRASRSAAGAARGENRAYDPAEQAPGRSRGGFGTKVHLVVDGHGIPLAATISAGQAHESKRMAATLEAVRLRGGKGRPRTRPKKLAGDKGYSFPAVRAYLRRRGILPVIPTRKDQRANRALITAAICAIACSSPPNSTQSAEEPNRARSELRSPQGERVVTASEMRRQDHSGEKREGFHEIPVSLVHSIGHTPQERYGLLAIARRPVVTALETEETGVHDQVDETEDDTGCQKSQFGRHHRRSGNRTNHQIPPPPN